jgi:hypothetical protein
LKVNLDSESERGAWAECTANFQTKNASWKKLTLFEEFKSKVGALLLQT